MSVLEVAAAVGYSGTSRFGAAFKELYRQTPGPTGGACGRKMSKTGDSRRIPAEFPGGMW